MSGQNPSRQLHGHTNVLAFYCKQLSEQFKDEPSSDHTWCITSAQFLEKGAQDLLDAAELLRARAQSLTQSHLPLEKTG